MRQFTSASHKATIILVSKLWTALIGIIFVPLYVKLIGAESYGLVAFYATLSGALIILDVGLSASITRQTVIYKVHNDKGHALSNLTYSASLLSWAIAILAGIFIISLSPLISSNWIKAKDLPISTIRQSVILMGLLFAFQFPSSIYNGSMIGLNKQVANAIINVIFSTLKAVGVILILKFINYTITAYFIWQIICTIMLTVTLGLFVWKDIKVKGYSSVFSKRELNVIKGYATGMAGISLITFFLSQIDKIVVSKFVYLDYVGYYNLAFLVAGAISQIISPFQPIVLPKFTALVAQDKNVELKSLYHKISRWISIIVFPVGLSLVFFAKEILWFWTKNEALTNATAPILMVVAIGTICNCLMWTPYFYMLAKGNTKFTIYQNIIASVILVPALFLLTIKYGALGASFVWLIVNAGYVIFSAPVFHNFFLKGELWGWYKNDIAYPLIITLLIITIIKTIQILYIPDIKLIELILLLLVFSLLYVLMVSELRNTLFRIIKLQKKKE